MIKPETTRPLYWIAQEHGADYTDVLNYAWSLKQERMTGVGVPVPAWGIQLFLNHPGCIASIAEHIDEFMDQQGWPSREEAMMRAGVITLEPGFVHKGP